MSDLGNKEIMAANIKRYLSIKAMNMKDLSRAIDVPYTTVCSWCNADSYPRIDKIEKMAILFGINKADLVEQYVEKNTLSEREQLLQEAFDNPDRRILFSLNEKATDQQVKVAIQFMKTLLGEEE